MSTVLAGRFDLLSQAARGGMASVWRGRDRKTNGPVAIKTIAASDPVDLARFEREASLLATLDHPNVVVYVAHGVTEDGGRYLVEEWVDGITLSSFLANVGVTAAEAVRIAIGVADALGAAHRIGVVHRDVKPSNVILVGASTARVKLVDFGIARAVEDAGVLTRTGVLVGTPSYMSPEQSRGTTSIEPTADVWALGCLLYEALSGRKAFAGRTPEAVRAKVLLATPEPVSTFAKGLPDALVELVHAMLSKVPAERPATGVEAAAALRALVEPGAASNERRRVSGAEPPTKVLQPKPAPMTPEDRRFANCFVFVSAVDGEHATPLADIRRIATRHDLQVHELDDGAVLLAARVPGPEGALGAARAALDLEKIVADGAISVFARAAHEPIADALDRGAAALEKASMAALFADMVEAKRLIPVDDVIAELVGAEVDLEHTDAGHGLSARRTHTG